MIKTLLIANRGEIACRIMRTARAMGINTVAVYSQTDAGAMHVQEADYAMPLEGETAADSYLVIDKIIAAAKASGADAIHPGYGFLSENAAFASACETAGLAFVGPPASAIEAMGSKAVAKDLMQRAGVPLLPGASGHEANLDQLRAVARDMGYPILLKAASGGGGKGMRAVTADAEFEASFLAAQREARSSFGDDLILVEKLLERPRHVEVQVFFDQHGEGVALFDRDCSTQRRFQKVVEEAPAPGLSDVTRVAMRNAALQAAKAIDYVGAGTIEFLVDENEGFYFMEMNTRLQVEHPVTEAITGTDLVAWQLKIASGEPLPCTQSDLQVKGHAIEVRLYAEDPGNDYLPSTGLVHRLKFPEASEHVRIDAGIREGDAVSVHFDPMIAKIITWGEGRDAAAEVMQRVLQQVEVAGVATNLHLLQRVLASPAFRAEPLHTGLLGCLPESEARLNQNDRARFIWVWETLGRFGSPSQVTQAPWQVLDGFRPNLPEDIHQWITVDGQVQILRGRWSSALDSRCFRVGGDEEDSQVYWLDEALHCVGAFGHWQLSASERDNEVWLSLTNSASVETAQITYQRVHPGAGRNRELAGDADLTAPMTGRVVQVSVSVGDTVHAGDVLVVLEAMKMEHAVRSGVAGQVMGVHCAPGDLIQGGVVLVEVEAEGGD